MSSYYAEPYWQPDFYAIGYWLGVFGIGPTPVRPALPFVATRREVVERQAHVTTAAASVSSVSTEAAAVPDVVERQASGDPAERVRQNDVVKS